MGCGLEIKKDIMDSMTDNFKSSFIKDFNILDLYWHNCIPSLINNEDNIILTSTLIEYGI